MADHSLQRITVAPTGTLLVEGANTSCSPEIFRSSQSWIRVANVFNYVWWCRGDRPHISHVPDQCCQTHDCQRRPRYPVLSYPGQPMGNCESSTPRRTVLRTYLTVEILGWWLQGSFVEGSESRFTTYSRTSAATLSQLFIDHGLYTYQFFKTAGYSTVTSYYPNGAYIVSFLLLPFFQLEAEPFSSDGVVSCAVRPHAYRKQALHLTLILSGLIQGSLAKLIYRVPQARMSLLKRSYEVWFAPVLLWLATSTRRAWQSPEHATRRCIM